MKVLLLGAGGAGGIGVTRSLHAAGHEVVGTDCTDPGIALAETTETFPLPPAMEHGYMVALWNLLGKVKPDFTMAWPDQEVRALSLARNVIRGYTRYMLPRHQVIAACQDKFASYLKWKKAGLPVPETQLVRGREAIFNMTNAKGQGAWLRPRTGGGGNGSFKANSYTDALQWVRHVNGWGEYTIADVLPGKSVTWMSLWQGGNLVACQQRRRLAWSHSKTSPSGVTGTTGIGETCADPKVHVTAFKGVLAVDDAPHGLYGVDMTYNEDGDPYLTEINCGRFFTTIDFFTKAGFNFPDLYVRTGMGENVPRSQDPIPAGKVWVRLMDREPVLL